MRIRAGWLAAGMLLATASCLRTVVTHASGEFPVRPGWPACIRERLEGLGYTVAGDSVIDARRGRLRVTIQPAASYARRAADSVTVPTVRITANGAMASDVDSLSIYCGGVQLPM